ncbi:Na+/H+ antiporter subunit E [Acuticoccus sp. MNP-M23]|uniref:Na+/H+ antiporter subunit E n=1 Tax=Acuticoccus sp. MNP-M23 TaxID=3072793 RepID=UPI002814E4ED|nr:Na+/H+ antiporter subunit E [Acuticoccus sp. MNP-M23]WMS42034.1 Na+/H+ antiporter subunit E [Acuticoccus sp. MNP-M23]
MATILVNLVLALAWCAVTGSFALLNLLFGFVLGGISLSLIREQVGSVGYFRQLIRAVELSLIFIWELVKSSVNVAWIVLKPSQSLRPAIIAFPIEVETDAEKTLLANLITLTPGTLSMDISDDGKTLFVHCIDAEDPATIIADIKSTFERRIEKVFHP